MCGLICSSLGNLLQYRERYQEGYNTRSLFPFSASFSLQYRERYQEGYNVARQDDIGRALSGCNTASGIRRATMLDPVR